jgi:hypothetical protein
MILETAKSLLSMDNCLRTVYHPSVEKVHGRFGGNVAKLIRQSKRRIDGDNLTIDTRVHNSFAARWGRNLNAGFGNADIFGFGRYAVRVSETAAENDMGRISVKKAITDLDLQRVTSRGAAAVADFLKDYLEDTIKDIEESRARVQYLGTNGLLGTVGTTTPTKNDTKLISTASAIAATGGARVKLGSGSIALFQRHRKLDVYNGNTKRFSVFVTDSNPRDNSVGLHGVDANGNESIAVDISAIAAGDAFYVEGEKDISPITLAAWLAEPVAGESFFGKDRTLADNRWMQPHFSGPTSATTFDPGVIDQAAVELGYINEDPEGGYLMFARPEIIMDFQNAVGADKILPWPTPEQKGKVLAQYGFDGAVYRHANLGRLMLHADVLMPQNEIWLLKPGSWEQLNAIAGKWRWMEGENGMWYRPETGTPGEGRGTVWHADGYGLACTICTRPWENVVIKNVVPSFKASAA